MIEDVARELAALRKRVAALERQEQAPVVAVYTSDAGQSISDSAYEIVNFEDQVVDTHSAVTIGASWKFTAPAGGYYLVITHILFAGTTAWAETERMIVAIFKEGVNYRVTENFVGLDSSGGSAAKMGGGSAIIDLAAGEYLDVRVYQNTGGALALNTSGAPWVHVSIFRIS